MNPFDWKISFTLRPLRLLQYVFMAALPLFSVVFPSSIGPEGRVRGTPESYARQNAYDVIDDMLARRMPEYSSEKRQSLAVTIVEESLQQNFDPLFVMAFIDVESRFDVEAVSPTGARGMMQILRATWREQVQRMGRGKMEMFNSNDNVTVGVGYMAYLARSFRRPESVALAYNQGPHMASEILANRAIPTEEASFYGPAVMQSYRRFLIEAGINPNQMRTLWRNPSMTIVQVGVLAPWEKKTTVTCQTKYVAPRKVELVSGVVEYVPDARVSAAAIYPSHKESSNVSRGTAAERCFQRQPLYVRRLRLFDGGVGCNHLSATCRLFGRHRPASFWASLRPLVGGYTFGYA